MFLIVLKIYFFIEKKTVFRLVQLEKIILNKKASSSRILIILIRSLKNCVEILAIVCILGSGHEFETIKIADFYIDLLLVAVRLIFTEFRFKLKKNISAGDLFIAKMSDSTEFKLLKFY